MASLVVFCATIAAVGAIQLRGWQVHRFVHLVGPWQCSAEFTKFGVQIVVLHGWKTPVVGPVVGDVVGTRRTMPPQYFTFIDQFTHYMVWRGPFGFEYGPTGVIRQRRVQIYGSRTWFMFPFRYFAAVLLLLPVIRFGILPMVRWIKSKRRAGGCRKCGYDLTGNVSGVCPECGSKIATEPPP
jgi:hypothetical protein